MGPTLAALDQPPAIAPTIRYGSLPDIDRIGQRGIRRLVREILLAGEEANQGPPLLRDLIADRAAQHRVLGLERRRGPRAA